MSAVWLAAGLTVTGWASLSHAMPRHYREAFGHEGGAGLRSAHRAIGALGLAGAFASCVIALGWEFGPVMWTALLCLGGTLWVLCRNASPRAARWIAWAAPLPGLLSTLI